MNAILTHIKAKSDEIGLEAAAAYYSQGPGKKSTAAQLAKVLSEDEMPTPRMCLRVVEDLAQEVALLKAGQGALLSAPTTKELEDLEAANLTLHQQKTTLRIENDHLRAENVNLETRIRSLEAIRDGSTRLAAQGFAVQQPFNPPVGTPVVQPWVAQTVNGINGPAGMVTTEL